MWRQQTWLSKENFYFWSDLSGIRSGCSLSHPRVDKIKKSGIKTIKTGKNKNKKSPEIGAPFSVPWIAGEQREIPEKV